MKKKLNFKTKAFLLALLLIIKHHSNITRLKNGTENKLFAKKQQEDEDDGEEDAEYEEFEEE